MDMELPLLLALGLLGSGPKRRPTMLGHVARAKAELREASRGIQSRLAEKSKLGCRTEERMMRLPLERVIARTVYEEVRFVPANRADSICGKWPNIQFSWLQL